MYARNLSTASRARFEMLLDRQWIYGFVYNIFYLYGGLPGTLKG